MASPGSTELDEVTLVRAQRGDEQACRALVLLYQRPIFALISRLTGRTPAVEDLAQDTFLRAFRALHAFDRNGAARLSTWLITIATRLCLDELRRRKPERGGLESIDAHADSLPAADRTDAGAMRTPLERALASLPADQRAAILLRELHGFSTAEVAQALSVEEGTVKSRLSRAKAALRERLEDRHE